MTMPKGTKTSEDQRREDTREMDKLHRKAMILELVGALLLITGIIMLIAGIAIVISGNVGANSTMLIVLGLPFTAAGSIIMKRGKTVRDQVYYPPYR